MPFVKEASLIFIIWLLVCFLVVVGFDAYWYERVGDCNDCIVLGNYFEWREQ